MDPVRNPYSPGAGTRPPALVGREREIDAMDIALQRLLLGRDGRSEMLTGLRGVGKTVLLNEFEHLADARGYFHEHIEVSEDGELPPRLAAAFRRVLLSMDARRRIGERVHRALGILTPSTGRPTPATWPPTWPGSSSSWARWPATTAPACSSPSTSSTT